MGLGFDEFRTLAIAEIDSLHRLANSLVRNTNEADDLVQETYLRAIRSWKTFSMRDHGIRPWLMRILHNTHITRATVQTREKRRLEPSDLDNLPAANPEPRATLDWSQFDGELVAALGGLPESLRSTMTLWAMEELTYKEIAEILSVPIGTVMSRLHRARQALQEALKGLAQERGIRRE